MPARCAVAGCSNTNKDGVALHKFPKENKLKAQWTRFVKLTRADFTQPTQCQYQTICEVHFTSDCYDQKYKIKQTLGFSEKSKKLLPGSVPSIYPKIIKDSVTICTPPTKKRKTLTSHKRDIHRMIQHEIDPSNSSICDLDNQLLEEQAASTSSLLDISKDRTTLLQNAVKSVMVQASPKCKEKGTNYSYKPYYRSVGVQVDESEFKKILEPKCKEATTEDGNGDVMWESVCNHVQNIHKGHNQLFPECLHVVGLQRKWLLPGTKVCERLTDLLTTNQVKRDVKKLSPIYQTSNIEAYHSVINHFAPKMIGFSFHGMYCRLLIAAIHYNENNSREQASTRDGQLKYDVIFPKYKKGDYIVRECKKATSYGYVKRLVSYAAEKCESHNRTRIDVNVPPPLCSTYYHPQKEEAVKMKTSRFANK